MKKDELVWVDKETAERLKHLETENATNEQRQAVFDQYIQKVSDAVRNDFKANLESVEEDAAIFSGLMLKAKQAFGKAKDEHLNASYELWEKFEAEIPSIKKKTESIISVLTPLKNELKEINGLIGQINLRDVDLLVQSINSLAGAYGTQKQMIEFLVTHFVERRNES